MYIRLIAAFAVALPPSALADETPEACPDFGLESAYLQQLFCEQLTAILRQTGQERSNDSDETAPDPDATQGSWRALEMLDDAYSRDPKKTLALIDRIKSAGGLEAN